MIPIKWFSKNRNHVELECKDGFAYFGDLFAISL